LSEGQIGDVLRKEGQRWSLGVVKTYLADVRVKGIVGKGRSRVQALRRVNALLIPSVRIQIGSERTDLVVPNYQMSVFLQYGRMLD
jgi:hypothetical protein